MPCLPPSNSNVSVNEIANLSCLRQRLGVMSIKWSNLTIWSYKLFPIQFKLLCWGPKEFVFSNFIRVGQKCLATPLSRHLWLVRAMQALTADPPSSLFLKVLLFCLLNVLLQQHRITALLLHKKRRNLPQEAWWAAFDRVSSAHKMAGEKLVMEKVPLIEGSAAPARDRTEDFGHLKKHASLTLNDSPNHHVTQAASHLMVSMIGRSMSTPAVGLPMEKCTKLH